MFKCLKEGKKGVIQVDSIHPPTKYVVEAKFEVNGPVEKPDVIGALFGQAYPMSNPKKGIERKIKGIRIGLG